MIRSKYLFPLILLACSLLVQDISSRFYKQIDLTSKKLYSLSEITLKLLEKISPEEVKVKVFVDETDIDRGKAEQLIRLFKKALPSLQYEIISPTKHPFLVQQYGIDKHGMVLWEWRDKHTLSIGFNEEAFTSGLRKLVEPKEYVCYALRGKGEKEFDKELRILQDKMRAEHYRIESIRLEERGTIPEDAALLLWLGPKEPLLPKEEELLHSYLVKGGRFLACIDPLVPVETSSLLRILGLKLTSDVVVDTRSQLFRGDFFFATAVRYYPHLITRGLSKVSVFPLARSIQLVAPAPPGMELFPLIETSDTAWAEFDTDSLLKASPQVNPEIDRKGPLVLAVAGELRSENATYGSPIGRFVLFGDTDFITDGYIGIGDNMDLFLNAVAWAVEREEGIALRPKDPMHQPLILSRKETILLGIGVMGVLPGIFLLLSLFSLWKKKE
ncbi:MAG: Gldg family protein [Spirochaetales bacterium]